MITSKGIETLLDTGIESFNTLQLGTAGVTDFVNETVDAGSIRPTATSDTQLQNFFFAKQGTWSRPFANLNVLKFEVTIGKDEGNQQVNVNNPTGKNVYTEFGLFNPSRNVLFNRVVITPNFTLTPLTTQITETAAQLSQTEVLVSNRIESIDRVTYTDTRNNVTNITSLVSSFEDRRIKFSFVLPADTVRVDVTYQFRKNSFLIKTRDFSVTLRLQVNLLKPLTL